MGEICHKSLKMNMVLNAIKGIMSIIFPLITFPYVSRILGVDNLGKFNFASSIINYFILLAGLGISTYAVREGARLRDNKIEIDRFSSEVFTINCIATVISYVLFGLSMLIIPKFVEYKDLFLILSLQIVFTTLDVEWVYSIYENYFYITLRTILLQVISIVLLLLFVKTEFDLINYTWISLICCCISGVLNIIFSKKYVRIGIVKNVNWKKHLKPIFVLFATAVAISIYVSSDVVILGFLNSDYEVGIYLVSVKVYTVIKTILSSVLVVSIPKLSSCLENDNLKAFKDIAKETYNTLLFFVIPTIIGVILLRKELVLIISGEEFLTASTSLGLLGIALFFCMAAWFWGQCILVPMRMEKYVFIATIISALINIILNLVLIPGWGANAAAFTTIIAEGCAVLICMGVAKKRIYIFGFATTVVKVLFGCVGIVFVDIICKQFILNSFLRTAVIIVFSVFIYGMIEIALKNETATSIANGILTKIRGNN